MKTCPKCGEEYPDSNTLCPSDGVALETTSDELLGQTLAGKYRIDEKLSEGGMGTVYKGTHVLMDKTVAVKVLRPSLAADEKIVARFSREARAASRISHPHAISVTDFGEDENGIVFLVMEYLEGETLKDLIRREGPLSLARVVEIIKQVSDALNAAHEQGVVHRDLKSDNIMLLSATGNDYAKVLDFGIAKIKEREGDYDPGLTAPDLVIGTPQYMSPEQCSQASDIDARSDIYSLGVITYEMLVGHVPFTGASPTEIMMKHLQQPAPSVLKERSDLPAAVGRVVARALEKQPQTRYASANELVEDLIIAADMEPAPLRANSDRLVVPTGSGGLVDEDRDEETLVRKRLTTPMPRPSLPPEPSPIASFTPWKILIPSTIGLLVIFAAIYVFTRRSPTPTTEAQPASGLSADPNSQPVEPAQPPTGQAESGIPTGGPTNQNANANRAASPSPTESPADAVGFDPNVNDNANANSNVRKNPPLPSPTQTVEEAPPPPTPKPATPKPTLPPPSSSPPATPAINPPN
ncbi:MAG: protein kinase [bacterium]